MPQSPEAIFAAALLDREAPVPAGLVVRPGIAAADRFRIYRNNVFAGLSSVLGDEFDRAWLAMMIDHHRGAVDMAQTEIDEGFSADAIAMASNIVTVQNDEIAEFEQQLERQ